MAEHICCTDDFNDIIQTLYFEIRKIYRKNLPTQNEIPRFIFHSVLHKMQPDLAKFMSLYWVIIKVLTSLASFSTKGRHKRGVISNNTSSDFATEVFFSIYSEKHN